MLIPVHARARTLDSYDEFIGRSQVEKIRGLAGPLHGLRAVHISATPAGGGVAEILQTLIPLSRGVGLDAHWYVLPPDEHFFEVTKRMHNWLQGKRGRFRQVDRDVY